jgi:uncharacterized membrane protein (UPF0127 family)
MKKLILLLELLVVLALVTPYVRTPEPPLTSPLYSLRTIEIADAPEERERGLSGRFVIPDDYGMLFVFPEASYHGFWMKGMLAPIDIIWVNADGTVAGVSERLSPKTFPQEFRPPVPVPYVLEVRAGLAAERGFATGTPLALPIP